MSFSSSKMQSRPLIVQARVHANSALYHPSYSLQVTLCRKPAQLLPERLLVCLVDLRAVLQQQVSHSRVTSDGRVLERIPAPPILDVDVPFL